MRRIAIALLAITAACQPNYKSGKTKCASSDQSCPTGFICQNVALVDVCVDLSTANCAVPGKYKCSSGDCVGKKSECPSSGSGGAVGGDGGLGGTGGASSGGDTSSTGGIVAGSGGVVGIDGGVGATGGAVSNGGNSVVSSGAGGAGKGGDAGSGGRSDLSTGGTGGSIGKDAGVDKSSQPDVTPDRLATDAPTVVLTVSKTGTGGGIVASNPAGIDCGSQCSAAFAPSTPVELTANSNATSIFTGWSAPCSGTGTCTVTMSQAASVGASFVFGCDVGTGAVENGAKNPNNACQTCQPNKTTKGWSNLTSATGCGPTVIAAGNAHTCAVVHGGAVQCWGANLSGQLGDNASNADTSLPVQVFGLTTGAQSVVAGSKFTCAVVSGGVQCWGDDGFGALGYNPPGSSPAPVRISSLSSGVEKISAGWQHACAVVSGGVKCWGDNMAGDLGNNSTVTSSAPVQVDGITAGAQSVAAGFYHSCAVVNGGVQCWGGNQYGQLGNNSPPPVSANPDFNSSLVPAQVYGLTSGVRAVAAGDNFACALVGTGVWCWGDNSGGALGNNSLGNNSFVPVQVNGLGSGVTAIAAGAGHACAIVGTGVWCWGYGVSGQLGNNSTTSSPVPVAVNGLGAGVTAIAAGAAHTCALVNGNVRCWGSNSKGQLGNNSTEPTSLVPADPVVFQ